MPTVQSSGVTLRLRRRGLAPLAALAFLALVLSVLGAGSRGTRSPQVSLTSARGNLELTNSRVGRAVIVARNMPPGGSVRGQVTITNTGRAAGVVHLSKTGLVDTPGPRGGSLSKRLDLRVEEVTGGRTRRFYRGRLGGMPTLSLGSISPRQARTYRFTVSFPRGVPTATSARDNAYQGSSVRVGYLWRAKEEVERAAGRRIQGSAGDETLVGTPGNDLIVCAGGRDRVEGGGGSDVVRCGSGEDLIDGGAGDDRLFGGSGRDVIAGGPGDDELFGGSGYDRLAGGPGDDRLDGRFERGPRRP